MMEKNPYRTSAKRSCLHYRQRKTKVLFSRQIAKGKVKLCVILSKVSLNIHPITSNNARILYTIAEGDGNCVIEHRGRDFIVSGECSAWKPYLSKGPTVPERPATPVLQVPEEMNKSKSAPVSPAIMRSVSSEPSLRRTTSDDSRRSPLREAMEWFFKPIKPQQSGLARDMNMFSPQST